MTNEELAERQQAILDEDRIECLAVSDTLTDLKQVRELYASGKKDEAFDYLVSFVAGIIRHNHASKAGGYVGIDVVDRDGNIIEAGMAKRGQSRLVMEGFGPRARAAHFGPPQIVK